MDTDFDDHMLGWIKYAQFYRLYNNDIMMMEIRSTLETIMLVLWIEIIDKHFEFSNIMQLTDLFVNNTKPNVHTYIMCLLHGLNLFK